MLVVDHALGRCDCCSRTGPLSLELDSAGDPWLVCADCAPLLVTPMLYSYERPLLPSRHAGER